MLNSLGQVLPRAAQAFGDRTALVIDGRTFSFRELDGLSSALARLRGFDPVASYFQTGCAV